MYNNFQEAKEALNGRKHKKLANNTYARLEDDKVIIKLHDTDIITYTPRKVILNTGGWFTVTTKERLNSFSPFHIYQDNSIWYIGAWLLGTINPIFYDGIEVKYSGEVLKKCLIYGNKRKKEVTSLKKQVKEYLKAMQTHFDIKGIPLPDSGDCWICGFDGASKEHLYAHLKEKYIHGSLIVNALLAREYSKEGIGYILHSKLYTSIKQAVRGYFYRQLGIA